MVLKYSGPFKMNQSTGFCAPSNIDLSRCLTFTIFSVSESRFVNE